MIKRATKLGAVLVVLVLLVAAFFWAGGHFGLLRNGKPIVSSTTLGESYKDIAELSVEEYDFTNVARREDPGKVLAGWGVPFTGNNIMFTYDGKVKAGIKDASQITAEVNDATHKVTVTSPKVEITESKIDPATITVYDQSMNPFNQVKVQETMEFVAQEEQAARDKATENGLLDRAEKRTEELLTAHTEALLKGTGQEGYTIEVKWK
ncbi:DUF4230 domain-containing protein [Corynebacterium pyruviciproducens]